MKAPDVGLMALWSGQINTASDILKSIALHEMTPAEVAIAQQLLITISCNCDSIKKLIAEASK